ncbi:hypothetical protein MMC10_004615 [Thelotrema lepadinum]|nr:hypothetical protein [Thelotrema lepadinum]
MDTDYDDVASEVVADLDYRVRRLEFYLTGALELEAVPKDETSVKPSLYTRMRTIDQSITKLASQRRAVDDMLQLYSKYTDLFPSDTLIPSAISEDDEDNGADPAPREQLTTVNACAPMFPSTLSRLNLLKDLPIPPTETTASLLSIKPRLTRAETVQDSFASDVAELRLRSILLLQRWTKVGVQAAGHCWADWEERLMEVEQIVRRAEHAKAQEQQA